MHQTTGPRSPHGLLRPEAPLGCLRYAGSRYNGLIGVDTDDFLRGQPGTSPDIESHMSDQPPSAPNDEELLQRIHDGDEHALRSALERVTPRARGRLTILCKGILDDAELDDALQEGMIALWRSPPPVRPGISLEVWFFGVARHKAIDILRRRRNVVTHPMDSGMDPPVRLSDDPSDRPGSDLVDLFEAIATLSPLERTVIEADLACDGHADDDQLARDLDTTKQSIQVARSKARNKIRKYLHTKEVPNGGE
jgi:RNA polymerase sigma factor (sigma-70 family)